MIAQRSKCEMPSSLLLNSELFSSYRNNNTYKGLVGIAPSGAVTFISQLYTGGISDREIVIRSGLLDLPFLAGDSCLALFCSVLLLGFVVQHG